MDPIIITPTVPVIEKDIPPSPGSCINAPAEKAVIIDTIK